MGRRGGVTAARSGHRLVALFTFRDGYTGYGMTLLHQC
jgi:hypothetical protein